MTTSSFRVLFQVLFVASSVCHADDTPRGLFLKSRQSGGAVRATPRLALGYTILLRTPQGTIRVPPDYQFSEGDAVRLAVEANTDGHLYVFNRSDDGDARMIFPDARIRRGDSRIPAHIPLLLPANDGAGPWFYVEGASRSELLILVYGPAPVPGWPEGTSLLNAQPFTIDWEQLQSKLSSDATNTIFEGVLKSKERLNAADENALSRGLTLSPAHAPPAAVRMQKTPASRLVTEIVLPRK